MIIINNADEKHKYWCDTHFIRNLPGVTGGWYEGMFEWSDRIVGAYLTSDRVESVLYSNEYAAQEKDREDKWHRDLMEEKDKVSKYLSAGIK